MVHFRPHAGHEVIGHKVGVSRQLGVHDEAAIVVGGYRGVVAADIEVGRGASQRRGVVGRRRRASAGLPSGALSFDQEKDGIDLILRQRACAP